MEHMTPNRRTPRHGRPHLARASKDLGAPGRLSAVSLVVLAVLAILGTCAVARSVLVPIAGAFTLHSLFSPLVERARRRGVPRSISALAITLGLVAASGAALYNLAGPASEWLSELPSTSGQLTARLRELRAPVDRVVEASAQVEDLAAAASGSEVRKPDTVTVIQQGPSLFATAADRLSDAGISVLLALALLFLFLSNEGDLRRGLQQALGGSRSPSKLAGAITEFQLDLSRYLATITVINAGLGVCVGLALYALDMPNPVLWGVMAGLLNFVPYLGTGVGVIVVALASLVSFDAPVRALLPPLAYLGLSTVEGTVLTPWLIGRRLTLNSVAVLVSVLVWGFLWGVPGALLAVPLLMATTLVCKQIPGLKAVGELLGKSPPSTPGGSAPRQESNPHDELAPTSP